MVAGKTGTAAEAAARRRRLLRHNYVASFIGIVPAEHPQLVVLVVGRLSRTSICGGTVAAPAVQEIAEFALQHLEIAP